MRIENVLLVLLNLSSISNNHENKNIVFKNYKVFFIMYKKTFYAYIYNCEKKTSITFLNNTLPYLSVLQSRKSMNGTHIIQVLNFTDLIVINN